MTFSHCTYRLGKKHALIYKINSGIINNVLLISGEQFYKLKRLLRISLSVMPIQEYLQGLF